jgi:hypothetical protein
LVTGGGMGWSFEKWIFSRQISEESVVITIKNDNVTAYAELAKDEKIRKLFEWGRDMTATNVQHYMQMLHNENLPTPSFLDDLITDTTFSPFSDKLMLFHKMDMFCMKMRAFGNSKAVNSRHDVGFLYSKSFMEIGKFVQDAVIIMIENGWMEHAHLHQIRRFY